MDNKEGFSFKQLVVNAKQGEKLETDECNTSTDCNPKAKISLIGIRRQKNGRYAAVITDRIRHKKVWLGTFDTIEEASQAYFSKKSEFENEKLRQQGNKKSKRIRELTRIYNSEKPEELVSVKQGYENVNGEIFQTESGVGSEIDALISSSSNGGTEERIDSHKIGAAEEVFDFAKERSRLFNSGLMANVCGTKSSDECNKNKSCDLNAKISLIGVQRKQNEFEKLIQQGKKENKPKKNCDQIQQPESSSVVASLDSTASESGRAKRIDSQGEESGSSKATSCLMTNVRSVESSGECNITTRCDPKVRRSLIGIRRRKSGRYAAVITDPIKHKEVCLGTFDTIEEASQAYFSKKSEFEKFRQANKENKLKKNCDQIQQPESLSVVTSERVDSHKTTTRLIGAHKSKTTGRYQSEIINPITKKKIRLGTFGSAEEASHAYQSKKLEFQKLVKGKQQQCTYKRKKSEKLVNDKQGLEPLLPKSGSGSPDIDISFSNSINEGIVQSIDSDKRGTAEEAFHAYLPKKFDLQSLKNVEVQSNILTDSSAGEKQVGPEDDEYLWAGEWIQLPGDDRKVMFSLKLGLPIIDNYGYLLGEFSSLDDLSIN